MRTRIVTIQGHIFDISQVRVISEVLQENYNFVVKVWIAGLPEPFTLKAEKKASAYHANGYNLRGLLTEAGIDEYIPSREVISQSQWDLIYQCDAFHARKFLSEYMELANRFRMMIDSTQNADKKDGL